MDTEKIITILNEKYPGKNIIKNGEQFVAEIVCEFDPSILHPEKSVALAVIDRSEPHYHKKTVEHYRVVQGELTLYVNEFPRYLRAGDEYMIMPENIHYAIGDETWVEVVSEPGWTAEDHFTVKD